MAGLTNLFGGGDDRDDDQDAAIGVDGSTDDLGADADGDDGLDAGTDLDGDSLLGADGGMPDQSDEGTS